MKVKKENFPVSIATIRFSLTVSLSNSNRFLCFSGEVVATDHKSICLLGMRRRQMLFQPVEELKKETDFRYF